MHFMRERGPDAVRRRGPPRDRDRPAPGTAGPAPHRSLCFPPRWRRLQDWRDTCAFSLLDSTSPVWKPSEDLNVVVVFFLQRNLFSCLRNKARTLLAFPPPAPLLSFGLSAPLSGRKIDRVSWRGVGVSSGCSEAHSFPNFLLDSKALIKVLLRGSSL